MRWIPVGELQSKISRELKELPFGVTVYGKKWAKVLPLKAFDSKPVKEMKTKDILVEILERGVEYYRDNPDRITPNVLLQAVKVLEGMEKENEMEMMMMEGAEEAFDNGKPSIPEEEVGRGEE